MNNKKAQNRKKLDELADKVGDMHLMAMFWNMFDDLSATKQEYYIEWAERIVKEVNSK